MKFYTNFVIHGEISRKLAAMNWNASKYHLHLISNVLGNLLKLDESMACRHLSWMTNSNPFWPWKLKVKIMAKIKPTGHIWGLEFNQYVCFSFRGSQTIFGQDIASSIFDLENSRSRSWPRSSLMVTLEAKSSIDMFAFRFVAIGPFWWGWDIANSRLEYFGPSIPPKEKKSEKLFGSYYRKNVCS